MTACWPHLEAHGCCLQAYVFTILICIYLNDAARAHHYSREHVLPCICCRSPSKQIKTCCTADIHHSFMLRIWRAARSRLLLSNS